LGCRFCQNWDISKARDADTCSSEGTPDDIAQTAANWGCTSVAFTYNDPVIFAEYAIDTARACHARGVRTVAVTAGYISAAAREEFFSVMDATNIDLKAFTREFYRNMCAADLAPVLDTLRYVRNHTQTWLELTTLLIPGANDSPEELGQMTSWILEELGPDVPIHFTAFHPDYRLLSVPATPAETCRRAREQALEKGLRYVYTGNTSDTVGQVTRCPGCTRPLILRDGYRLCGYELIGSRCRHCEHELPGRFTDSEVPKNRPKRLLVHVPSAPAGR
jgi:pyruvate formate lyase activating enzyme